MAKTKILKKEWYPIIAPKIFNNAVLGETCVYEPKKMVGKCVKRNLMSLTNDVKRQNISVEFKINSVENGKAFADVTGYYMAQSSIRRLVRRGVQKISQSFMCKTSDNKNLRIKPLLITKASTTGSVVRRLGKHAHDFLINYVSSITYDNLINDLVNHKLQASLKGETNRIYPSRVCEIRSMEIVDVEKNAEDSIEKEHRKKEKSKPLKKAEESVTEKKADKAKESKDTEVAEQAQAEA